MNFKSGEVKPRGLGINTYGFLVDADVQNQWPLDSIAGPHGSIKFYPLPSEKIPACKPSNSPPQISPSNNRNWPLLPFSIPVFSVSSPDFVR